jgi:HEAT repeat protein
VGSLTAHAVDQAFRCGDLDTLLRALASAGRSTQVFAASRIGELGNPAACPALLQYLHRGDTGLRASCAEALGRLRCDESRKHLRALLDDQALAVQVGAIKGLGWLGDPDDVKALGALLTQQQAVVRATAIEALARHATAPAAAAISTALEHRSIRTRGSAIDALRTFPSSTALPYLEDRLPHEGNRLVRRWLRLSIQRARSLPPPRD